jgi:hypothetical protein
MRLGPDQELSYQEIEPFSIALLAQSCRGWQERTPDCGSGAQLAWWD